MPNIPLAERLRPRTIDEYIGQEHLVGKNGVFRKFFETGNVPSFILWGPPGVGKTTLAKIVATQLERPFFTLSAVMPLFLKLPKPSRLRHPSPEHCPQSTGSDVARRSPLALPLGRAYRTC